MRMTSRPVLRLQSTQLLPALLAQLLQMRATSRPVLRLHNLQFELDSVPRSFWASLELNVAKQASSAHATSSLETPRSPLVTLIGNSSPALRLDGRTSRGWECTPRLRLRLAAAGARRRPPKAWKRAESDGTDLGVRLPAEEMLPAGAATRGSRLGAADPPPGPRSKITCFQRRKESGRRDSNSRPLGPKPSALARLRYAPETASLPGNPPPQSTAPVPRTVRPRPATSLR